jgi:hypothetical protein
VAVAANKPALGAVFLGLLTLASLPVCTLLAGDVVHVTLVRATVAGVCATFVFGLVGLSASRRARFRVERSLSRRGARLARLGRILVLTGLYLGLIGAIALGFYGVVLAIQ